MWDWEHAVVIAIQFGCLIWGTYISFAIAPSFFAGLLLGIAVGCGLYAIADVVSIVKEL